jgi:outer membrane receptor for ferrienterochelin and colicins
MRLLIVLLTLLICTNIYAQQTIRITVTNNAELPIAATVSIKGTADAYATDSSGLILVSFPANGDFTLVTTSVGFEEKQTNISIPFNADTLLISLSASENEEMEEVIVQSTRTSRTIANVPTRVETIELEEIDEKNNMRPANVAMILHESTGIQVQQTSATSGNANIRIQGLDGRYTQILKDGFPNFGNFSSGLSILEIPPLDLKQVEIIKGPVSPLFGGGAIAGVVNFISRTPRDKPEYNFIINHSNIGQTNIGGFASARNKKSGYTFLALYNSQKPYDVDKDDFTEVPESREITVHPKIFFYPNEAVAINIGNSITLGKRTGGDINVIRGKPGPDHQYLEENKTTRNTSTLEIDKKIGTSKRLLIKQSFSFFNRQIRIPSYVFAGKDKNAFTDVSYISTGSNQVIVLGANFIYNNFNETKNAGTARDNTGTTAGAYAQHTWDINAIFKLETGLRVDLANYRNSTYSNKEAFILPRLSLLTKFNNKWSSRVGLGMGYKTPTLFTEETETIQYRNVAQLNFVKSEESYGGTADVNFRTNITEDLAFTFNHMFFYTEIHNPLVLVQDGLGNYAFMNARKPVTSSGFETNARFIFKDHFKLFLGYTYTDAKAGYQQGNTALPLVPGAKLNTALIYEKEGVIKLGLEGYFTGSQYLSNGTRSPAFKELGFMAEKIFKKFSVYINFENFTDTRQSNYKNVVNGSHLNPTFDEIFTHTEGFVFNGGIKLKL